MKTFARTALAGMLALGAVSTAAYADGLKDMKDVKIA